MILADNETKVDLLNNQVIAAIMVQLLRDRPDRPVTFGVHGDWGAGNGGRELVEERCLDFASERFRPIHVAIRFATWLSAASQHLIQSLVTAQVGVHYRSG